MLRIAAVIALLVLLAVGQQPERTLLWDALFDAGHVPLFGAIALLMRGALAERLRNTSPARTSAIVFGLTLALGLVTEIVQAVIPNRDAAWIDLARNAAGAASFLLLWHAWTGRQSTTAGARRSGVVVAAVALLLVALALAETADTLVALYERARALPTVVAFDGARWESKVVRTGANRLTPAGAARAAGSPAGLARLDLLPATYSGLSIDEPYPDWRGYTNLVLTVVSDEQETLPLTIRIHDAKHDNRYRDRYNTAFRITKGEHILRIPLDEVRTSLDRREMDMRRIRGIVLFVHRLDRPAHLYLGPMRLE